MKTIVSTILLVIIFLSICPVQAYAVWDIYSDTDIYDGFYDFINIYDTPPNSTTVNMYGGNADFVSTFDSSTLNFYGGNAEVGAFDTSFINISGGVLSGVESWDNAIVHFVDEAYSQSLGVGDYGTVNMSGGTVQYLHAGYDGVMNLYAGSVIDSLNAWSSATVNVFGYDLFITSLGGSYNCGYVTGFWNDNTPFTIDFSTPDTYLHVNLIPEPSSLILLMLGTLALRRKG
jgi:hypothetical protein